MATSRVRRVIARPPIRAPVSAALWLTRYILISITFHLQTIQYKHSKQHWLHHCVYIIKRFRWMLVKGQPWPLIALVYVWSWLTALSTNQPESKHVLDINPITTQSHFLYYAPALCPSGVLRASRLSIPESWRLSPVHVRETLQTMTVCLIDGHSCSVGYLKSQVIINLLANYFHCTSLQCIPGLCCSRYSNNQNMTV